MTSTEIKRIVKIVVDARKAKESNSAIADRLANAGVPTEDTPNVIDAIEKGFKHGILSVVNGWRHSPDDSLFDRVDLDADIEASQPSREHDGW